MRWFTHIDSQINKLLSKARFTRYSGRSSFERVDYYSQAGKHRLDHYQRLHTPSKLLHRRIKSISGSPDDDGGHPHTGRLQCSPLIVAFQFYRFERHYAGEHGVWPQPTRVQDLLAVNVTSQSPADRVNRNAYRYSVVTLVLFICK